MAKDRGDIVESVAPVEEPASEGALEARERVTPVDQVVCTGVGIILGQPRIKAQKRQRKDDDEDARAGHEQHAHGPRHPTVGFEIRAKVGGNGCRNIVFAVVEMGTGRSKCRQGQ